MAFNEVLKVFDTLASENYKRAHFKLHCDVIGVATVLGVLLSKEILELSNVKGLLFRNRHAC